MAAFSLTFYRRGSFLDDLGEIMPATKADLLQGTLDMLILKAVEHDAIHGFGISVRLRRVSKEVLQVEQGSLYPALYRLEEQGLIHSEWGVSDNNRKAKFYSLTPAGRRHLKQEAEKWSRVSTAVNLVLSTP
jgi:transcriptional regulator